MLIFYLIFLFFLLFDFLSLFVVLSGFVKFGKRNSRSFKLAETNVILSDDTGIKRVKVEQYDKIVIHTFFGLNDHTTSVFLLVSLLSLFFIFEILELVWND